MLISYAVMLSILVERKIYCFFRTPYSVCDVKSKKLGFSVGTCLQDLLDQFIELGEWRKILSKVGENGRGVFPIDSLKRSKIMTPENLLINIDNLGIKNGDYN